MSSSSPVSRPPWPWPTRPSSTTRRCCDWPSRGAEDAGVVERYQRQLGLPLSTLARLLGPSLVKSVALTGSDPSFPLGTDVAVLLETPQPAMLGNLLLGRIAMAAGDVKDAKAVGGTIDGLAYQGFVSPDRSLSSYVAQLDGAVVVTNSTLPVAATRGGPRRQSEVAGRAAGIYVLPHPLSPRRLPAGRLPCERRCRGVGLDLPQRRHDPPLVRAAVADRRFPPHVRPGRAGRVAGLAA